jgi:transcriptional regulator with XRE-family HTH domain
MELGEKIRLLRKQRNLTLAELAQQSGLGLGTLSRLENNKASSNVKTHQRLCEALGISLADLYRDTPIPPAESAPRPTSPDEAEIFTYDEKASSILLAANVLDKHMLPQLIVLQPGGQTHREQNRPMSEKWLFVLEGVVEVTVSEQRHELHSHGTLYFKSSLPHQIINAGPVTAKCITVTSPVGL